jgi:malonyl-CoA O-methyltransferase
MQSKLQKRAIRAAFSDAAANYDGVAHVQRRIADALLQKCHPVNGITLDAGCGTGYALNALRSLGGGCLALDHANAMLEKANDGGGDVPRVCGDIEALPLRDSCIALYYSSLAWQWTEVARAIDEAARALEPGGQLAVATLGPDTLKELREAFQQADSDEHVRHFTAIDTYSALLQTAGFEAIEIQRTAFVVHAQDFRSMLHDIKTLGAHVVDTQRRQGLFGVQRFRRAETHHERLREPDGLPLTYDAVFITARRRPNS